MRYYNWPEDSVELQAFHGEPYAAIDPGKEGAVVVVQPAGGGIKEPAALFSLSKDEPLRIGRYLEELGVSLVVLEDQYSSINKRTGLVLSFESGRMLGEIGAAQGGKLKVVRVSPSVWQSRLLPGAKNRKETKHAAAVVAQAGLAAWDVFSAALKKAQMEGINDAWCIAQWWAWDSEKPF